MAGPILSITGNEIATRAAFGAELVRIGAEIPSVVVLDADLRSSTQTGAFAKQFPERAFNVGIAEQDLVATAAGFAVAGKKPFACSFSAFLIGRAYDQIRTTIALSEMPVVLAGTHSGILTGEDGATHQALEDIGLMRALPTMTVFSPADATEARALTRFAATYPHPLYLRLGRAALPVIFPEDTVFTPAKVRVLNEIARPKVVLFTTGALTGYSLIASQKIASTLAVRVVHVAQISPLDSAGVIEALSGAEKVMTAEDHSIDNGLGSAIAEILAENGIGKPLFRHGMRRFGESGSTKDLYEKYQFDSEGIAALLLRWGKGEIQKKDTHYSEE